MPRNVRNFWLEASIDGRESSLSGGPRGKEGGFCLDIYIREMGTVKKALGIYGDEVRGKLLLTIRDSETGEHLYKKEVDR
ncbi:MAG: hypothetical protein WC346_19895 [Methanogenium sp.]|jgi:hypothetical protein